MAECEKLATCPFYQGKLVVENDLAEVLKAKYCMKDKEKCARYKVFSEIGPEYVDNLLFPHMMNKALFIIAENKNKTSV